MLAPQLAPAHDARLTPEALPRYAPIGDYGIVGDCRSIALISRFGSIDWMCVPRIDKGSVFAKILDADRGGHWSVRPTAPFTPERHYLAESNVLSTTFTTDGGKIRILDSMPVASEATKCRTLWPMHEVCRVVECTEGAVEVEVDYAPRPSYGRCAKLKRRKDGSLACQSKGRLLLLRSEIDLEVTESQAGARGTLRLEAGERCALSLVYAEHMPAVLPALGDHALERTEETNRWWRSWIGQCTYTHEHRAAVVRSLLALKLLTYAPSGAVVAAATCSLPERIGGARNWDYRYCWIRDASMTIDSFLDLGFEAEGKAFVDWLLHTTRRTAPTLHTMYDVYGGSRLPERELDFEGYRGSRPVRIGNGAVSQLQLDAYGEILHAISRFVDRGGRLDRATQRLAIGFGRTICDKWMCPDEGIWEIRSEAKHFVYSKVMCWVGLQRLIELHDREILRAPRDCFARVRDEIRDTVERRGYREDLGSYVGVLDGDDVDAALLLLARYGYLAYDDPKMKGTVRLIEERLTRGPLVYRYRNQDDGLDGSEGAFGICSFWLVDCLARQGRLEEAERRFSELLEYTNDLGLLGEEIDPEGGGVLGNFPQAFTHVGLVDAALTLEEIRRGGSREHPIEEDA